MDNTLDFHASHANISPRTWCQKTSPLFVAFVSKTLNLDPKTYLWALGSGWPPRGYGPAAHARPGPQRTQTASNSKKEGLQKGHAQVCTRPPAARKHTRLPRALAHNNARLTTVCCTVGVRGVGTVSPSASRRQPSPRITSRPRAPGHPPARAGPRLSRPLGRNPLSAGEWSPLGVLGPPGAPGLLTKRGKEDSTQGGTTHSNHKQ